MNDAQPRWPATVLAVSLSVLLAMLSLLTLVTPTAAQQGATASVSVVDFAFEPATLTVTAGTTVIWTNDGERPHTVTADDGMFDSGRLDPGEQFSFRFDQAGTYTYHCGFHPDMQATIVVTEGATDDIAVATAEDQVQAPVQTQEQGEDAAPDDEGGAVAEVSSHGPSHQAAPVERSRLAHIHAGTCEELGIVVYSLPDIRTYRVDQSNDATVGAIEVITGTANVELERLFGEPFSIHIHESAQNKQTYIACADVGGQPDAPWTPANGLTLEAQEQNGSGFSGFAMLQPTATGGTSISVALAAAPGAVEAVEAVAPAPSSTYVSPSFGYQIGYGEVWQESENSSTNGRDRFVLFNGKSYITFTGAEDFNGDPQACVDAFVAQLTADPAVSNLDLALDEDGQPLQGGTEATGAFAIFNHDYHFPDRVEPYTLFVGCVPLVPNEAVLAVVQNVPTVDYNEEVELRDALMRGLTLAQ